MVIQRAMRAPRRRPPARSYAGARAQTPEEFKQLKATSREMKTIEPKISASRN
jgi:hypothetical protein